MEELFLLFQNMLHSQEQVVINQVIVLENYLNKSFEQLQDEVSVIKDVSIR